jgi:hypothetical protein
MADADIAAVIAAWPKLSPNLRHLIVQLAKEHDGR